jgi:molybdate-binding protein
VAGTHFWDPERHQFNPLPEPQGQWVRIRYLEWETGLVGQPAPNAEVLWVVREPGSAARALLERHWENQAPQAASQVEVTSHLAVAQIVERNPKAQGVSLGLWADWSGIPFTRWAVEPFEWVTRRGWVAGEDERVALFCHWLSSPWVRQALGRYPAVHPNAPGSVIDPAS